MEGQQKEIQYPGWHKDTNGKGLWNKEDKKVPWGNIEVTIAASYSHWSLWPSGRPETPSYKGNGKTVLVT